MGSSLLLNRRPKVPAEDTAAFGAIAERFRRAGALEQAVSLCREGLKRFPDHVSARVTLGWSLLDLGKYDDARLELEQVMRRAPDNLAAIRGLAELHDRFEHTLNLPMDGPGQWPPPADSVELEPEADAPVSFEADDEPVAEEFQNAAAFAEASEFTAPNMAPPEMGLPLWTPEPTASAMTEALPSAPVTAAGTGMSSVREIDAFAGAPIPAQSPVSQPVEASAAIGNDAQAPGLIDETLAALIAEADSLEAAADLQVLPAASALEGADVAEFAEAIELEASDLQSVELAAVEMEAAPLAAALDAVELEGVSTPVVMEAVQNEVAAAPVEMETPALESAVAAVHAEAPEPEVDLASTTTDVVELELAPAPVQAETLEPEVDLAPAATDVVELEVAPASVQAEALEPEVDLASAAMEVVELEATPAEADIQAIDEAAHTAELITFASRPSPSARIAESEPRQLLEDERATAQPVTVIARKGTAAVVALERMLARVQARRLQLMTESVA